MDAWIASSVSALIVGLMMALFQARLNKSVDDARETSTLKFKMLSDKIDTLEEKQDALSDKIGTMSDDLHTMDVKINVVVNEQQHMNQSLNQSFVEFREVVKQAGVNYGKVILKP